MGQNAPSLSYFTQGWNYFKTHEDENVYDAVKEQLGKAYSSLEAQEWVDGFVASREAVIKRRLEAKQKKRTK